MFYQLSRLSLENSDKLIGSNIARIFCSFSLTKLPLSAFVCQFFNPRLKLWIRPKLYDLLGFFRRNDFHYWTNATFECSCFRRWLHKWEISTQKQTRQHESPVFVDDAVLHHEDDLLHVLDIAERVAGDGDDVGPFAHTEGADVFVPA